MSWQYCFCDIHAIKEIWMELNWREGERDKERERQRQRQRDRWGGQGGERMTRKLCFSVQHNGRYCCTLQPALFQQAYEGGTHGNICQDDFSKKKKKSRAVSDPIDSCRDPYILNSKRLWFSRKMQRDWGRWDRECCSIYKRISFFHAVFHAFLDLRHKTWSFWFLEKYI